MNLFMPVFFVPPTPSVTMGASSSSRFLLIRLVVALLLLAALLVGAIFTAGDEPLHQLHAVLVHSFELTLGAVGAF